MGSTTNSRAIWRIEGPNRLGLIRRFSVAHGQVTVPSVDQIYEAGDRIEDRFELTKPLGKGSFGVVWKGIDHQADGADVAIKFLFDKHRKNEKMVGRFVQEAKILEKLSHPGISTPIAWSADGEEIFLAMEFIDGQTLDRRFEQNSRTGRPVPRAGIAWMCDRICEAVAFAHQHDVVHRDIKPKNIMVNRPDAPPMLKVLDFGIAKMLVGSEIDPTTAGRVLGSVLYISPEQVLSKPIDHRVDMFSIASIMFELITMRRTWARSEDGRPHPFHIPIAGGELNSHVAVLKRIAREGRPSAVALRSDLSPRVDEVLHKALSIQPDDRYGALDEFALALRSAMLDSDLEGSSIPTLSDDEKKPTFDELATEEAHVPPAAPSPAPEESAPLPEIRRGPPVAVVAAIATFVIGTIVVWLLTM